MAQKMQAAGVPSAQVSSGYHPLPVPMTISGLPQARLEKANSRLDNSDRRVTSGFSATAAEDPIPINAGGNVGATLSYGDLTYGGVGTATAVCGDQVVGFGHPMALLGRSTYSMHGAEALYVQEDPYWGGSFKVANLAAPSGTVTQDRLAAILGKSGALPTGTNVSSHVTATNGNARDGSSTITETFYSDDIPYLTGLHLLVNEDRVFDAYAEGTAGLRWTVDLKTSGGTTLRYTRRDKVASSSDLTYATLWPTYDQLWQLQDNPFAKVQVTNVAMTSSLDEVFRAYTMTKVQRYRDGLWRSLVPRTTTINATSGSPLRMRAWIAPRGDSPVSGTWVNWEQPVGKYAGTRYGTLRVGGGEDTSAVGPRPDSLAEMLSQMKNAPTSDSVWGRLTVSTPIGKLIREGHTSAPSVVGGVLSFPVKITR